MYNASKAALVAASETLRHELVPFGVRTIALITTGVKTGSFSKYEAPTLPENSRYHGIQDLIDELADGKLQDTGMDPAKYAEAVVRKVDGTATGMVWAGADAFSARMAAALFPQWAFVSLQRYLLLPYKCPLYFVYSWPD